MRGIDQIVIDIVELKAAQDRAPRSAGPFRAVKSGLSGVETAAVEIAEEVETLRAAAEALGADMSFLDVEPEWIEAKPPIGPLVEYEQDNGKRNVARLVPYGAESVSARGEVPVFHDLFMSESGGELFRVVRWRMLVD